MEDPEPQKQPSLEVTWAVLDDEPALDRIIKEAGNSLEKMQKELEIYPYQMFKGSDRLFEARFEFPVGLDRNYPEGFTKTGWSGEPEVPSWAVGFMDFLCGFPIDCVEMLLYIGQFATTKDAVQGKPGRGRSTAPVPKPFFEWPEKRNIYVNLTALPSGYTEIFPADIGSKPVQPHWWLRTHLDGDEFFPVPGEFGALGVRMMPGEFWGKQKSSPFIYSGNWMDTVYYSGALVKEVIEPTQERPFPTYRVQWRKDEVIAYPTDFAEYKVDDRVTILKDVVTEKKTQVWNDADTERFPDPDDEVNWRIAPISFYGLDAPKAG
jgi:hypothetical protein